MRRNRPVAVLVIAILDMLFGVFGIFTGLGSCAGMMMLRFMPAPPGQQSNPFQEMQAILDREAPGHGVIAPGIAILIAVTALTLGLAAIWLLSMKRWAWRASIGAAASTIVLHILNTVYAVVYMYPAMMKWQEGVLAQQNQGLPPSIFGTMSAMNVIGSYATALFYCMHALAAIIVLCLPNVRAAFCDSGPRGPVVLEEYHGPGEND